jgi:hypothetical protein
MEPNDVEWEQVQSERELQKYLNKKRIAELMA